MFQYKRKAGFTFVELIVVMAVIAILVLLATPQFIGYTRQAKDTRLTNDIKVVSDATSQYLAEEAHLPDNWLTISNKELTNLGKGGALYGLKGPVRTLAPGDYKLVEGDVAGRFYANDAGDTYGMKGKAIVAVDDPSVQEGVKNEYLRTFDLTPIIEQYGPDATYSLSFDLKSKNTAKTNSIRIYSISYDDTKYALIFENVPVTETFQTFTFHNLKPKLANPNHYGSHLSFYGTYDTGNIPVVKNLKLVVYPND